MKLNRKHSTFIIAEAGVNHNGSLELAKKLVDKAKKAGADAIKFQTFKTELLVSKYAEKADYQKNITDASELQLNMLKRLELDKKQYVELFEYCKQNNIQFLSSVFEKSSVNFLNKLGLSIFKIPSGEIINIPLIKYIASQNKEIILSTGMATLGEVEEALEVIFSMGNKNVTLMHCVTEYPAPFNEVNLKAMLTLKNAFKLPIGYSDHTLSTEISIAAVALGATIIEKHFTLNKNFEGPDHKASLEPEELKQFIKSIRNVEVALGNGIKKPAKCESKNIPIVRQSVVARKKIAKGDIFCKNNLTIKRPGTGIQPKYIETLFGRKSLMDILADEVITWDKIL
jgi:N,N'-diacetyllegionaminate synthase